MEKENKVIIFILICFLTVVLFVYIHSLWQKELPILPPKETPPPTLPSIETQSPATESPKLNPIPPTYSASTVVMEQYPPSHSIAHFYVEQGPASWQGGNADFWEIYEYWTSTYSDPRLIASDFDYDVNQIEHKCCLIIFSAEIENRPSTLNRFTIDDGYHKYPVPLHYTPFESSKMWFFAFVPLNILDGKWILDAEDYDGKWAMKIKIFYEFQTDRPFPTYDIKNLLGEFIIQAGVPK